MSRSSAILRAKRYGTSAAVSRACSSRGRSLVPNVSGWGAPFSDPSGEDEGTARIRTGEFGNAHQGLEKDLVAAVRVSECADIIGVGAQIIEHKIPEAVGDDDPVGTLFRAAAMS